MIRRVAYWGAVVAFALVMGIPVVLFVFGMFFASFWSPPRF